MFGFCQTEKYLPSVWPASLKTQPTVKARSPLPAARAIRFQAALAGAVDLDRQQYASLHDQGALEDAQGTGPAGVVIDHVGTHDDHDLHDRGVAYYRYLGQP